LRNELAGEVLAGKLLVQVANGRALAGLDALPAFQDRFGSCLGIADGDNLAVDAGLDKVVGAAMRRQNDLQPARHCSNAVRTSPSSKEGNTKTSALRNRSASCAWGKPGDHSMGKSGSGKGFAPHHCEWNA